MPSHPAPARRPGWHWSDYWRSGRTEVMTVGEEAFDHRGLWLEYFARFDDGARLLDMATGGGQVARFALEAAVQAGRRYAVTGVDYADLSAAPPAEGLELIGGAPLEKLPFAAASFDGAASQYGIEYADLRLALGELARVLKPGAPALFLVHHAQGAVTRWTAEQGAAYDRVLGDGAAVRQARRAFTAHQKGLAAPAVAAAESAFREAVDRAAARLQDEPAYEPVRYFVSYLADLAGNAATFAPASALQRLDEFEAGNAAWRQRHRSQVAAALDGAGVEALVQRAVKAGFAQVDRAETRDARNALVGWRLEFVRG